MTFDILTLFPESFGSYFGASIVKRAIQAKKIHMRFHNFRDLATDKHHTVDDAPYGGGAGMVLKVEPIYRALKKIRRKKHSRVILLTPKGKILNQPMARAFARCDQLILICGRYEGFDERVRAFVDEEVSIGNYVLTGGELAAMVIVDAVARLIPGVLGDDASSEDESFRAGADDLEYPHYTRPETFTPRGGKAMSVPPILLSGDHAKIHAWRESQRKKQDPI
ncbi:MAG: tRNA (guanosine(37)-N1)-methyltransferase TrmD [Candidatus Kerfeldbacteria bacterium]|nr:tRNA (guanosine(37)-N1)-methyltransferase TrmD [Candidatus Kerfeldbacteria bacterium]